MPVTLDRPFSWEAALPDDRRMLQTLQPNILKGHVREFLTVIFLRFDQPARGRRFLRALTQGARPLMKSAAVHLAEVKAFNDTKNSASPRKGTPYVGVGLTKAGYDVLGIPAALQPNDSRFRAGMQSARGQLGDPDPTTWDPAYRGAIHAVVLVADQDAAPRDAALARVTALIGPGITELGREFGFGQHNGAGEGIEHFGYVDGRSQPQFLDEDVKQETLKSDGATNWNPAFGPGRAIVPDRAAPDPAHDFGSYFVFRKLEQNVRAFKQAERALATRLGLRPADVERAGAMLVGRFEDGTPLAIQSRDGMHNPVANDFTYESDPVGGKCPHFAHIRKMNPRGAGGTGGLANERPHIMARRGQTYGTRTDGLNDGQLATKPTGGVGLLFMAFNADIAEQFEFVQRQWANFAGFPIFPQGSTQPGPDPVIGQAPRNSVDCPVVWGADFTKASDHKVTTQVPQTVTMKGGEYFFMPSIAFLRALPA